METAAPDGDSMDRVIAVYKAGIDRSLLRENLKRTPEERLRNLAALQDFVSRWRGRARGAPGFRDSRNAAGA